MHIMITGASKGIGLAIARRFATENDVSLSICARGEAALAQARHTLEMEFNGLKIHAMTCDVSDPQMVAKFAEASQQRFGLVDVLINNAGFGLFKPVHEMTVDEFDTVLDTDLRGVYFMSREILPAMINWRCGTIVSISSLAGKNGFAGGAAYCAAKFGVRGLMQSLFLGVREFNIRVMTVFPGSVATDFFDTAGSPLGDRASSALRADDVAAAVYAAIAIPLEATISELDIRPTNPRLH